MMTATQAGQAQASRRGCFITLEGVDGAGKSTHVEWLAAQIRDAGHSVITTREPGGTPLGEVLRGVLLSHDMQADTEALLMFAARNEHLALCIQPALARGQWVVCDRFTDASYAYQGGGRGLSQERLAILEQWVHAGLQPDCTFLFDLSPELAHERLLRSRDRDRFEREEMVFFERTRAAYLARARAHPERFCILDSSLPMAYTRQRLLEHLQQLLGGFGAVDDDTGAVR